LIIHGPHSPKGKIEVYFQPLIDELKQLWNGVLTYDISKKTYFYKENYIKWSINDFPTYGMLLGWKTLGRLACLYCMNQWDGKISWFDSHC